MKISQKGLYALEALIFLARRYDQAAIKIREIATSEKLPEKFLELILLELKHARIVESVRGAKGGYRLKRARDGIYARGSFDVRNATVINATYDLPLGRRPSNDGDGRNPVRPSLNPNFAGQVILGGPSRYFNPSAFIKPLPGTYGNAGRNILQGPGLAETDLSLTKKFSFAERLNLQFRAEFFNVLNHTNFSTPNPAVFTSASGGPSPTAGVITATSTTSRQIQLGLKLLW